MKLPKNELVILEKDNLNGALSLMLLEEGTVVGNYDSRRPWHASVGQRFLKYGDQSAQSFETELEKTVENGWKIIWRGETRLPAGGVLMN